MCGINPPQAEGETMKTPAVRAAFVVTTTRTPTGGRDNRCEANTATLLHPRTDIDMVEQRRRFSAERNEQWKKAVMAEWDATKSTKFHHAIMLSLLVHEAAAFQRRLLAEKGVVFHSSGRLDEGTLLELQQRIVLEMSGPKDRYIDILSLLAHRSVFTPRAPQRTCASAIARGSYLCTAHKTSTPVPNF